jgi:hypothetical protein
MKRKLDNTDVDSKEKKISIQKSDSSLIDANIRQYRLNEKFYDKNCVDLSSDLLGKFICRRIVDSSNNHQLIIGRIVECEAYTGGDDKASHSYNNKRTEKVKAMYMKAGTCYVYNIYGIYCCFNVSAREDGIVFTSFKSSFYSNVFCFYYFLKVVLF